MRVQAESGSLRQHGCILAEEKAQLKSALAVALEHSASLEAALEAAHKDGEAQRAQVLVC